MTTLVETTTPNGSAGPFVPLTDGALPCADCGIAGSVGGQVEQVPSIPPTFHAIRSWRGSLSSFGRCPACRARHERAERYVADHEQWAASIGRYLATERVGSALTALAILGRDIADSDLGLMLPRLWPPAHQLHFASTFAARPAGHANPEPWSHVTAGDRDALRRAYAAGLRDRVALHEPAVPIPCPSGACLMCGVGSIERSAIEVSQRGGVAPTVVAVWRQVEGPDAGHCCPDCWRAVDEAGAIGQTATKRAVLAYAKTTGLLLRTGGGLGRLRNRVEDEDLRLPMWSESGATKPNLFRFAHLAAALDF